ncbi:MAG TPA: M81 family metallopeptidase, partial [Armatimonadota bacterium]|nr:M81 family metallopeptidase [Armatimonadota bacterium]
MLPPSRTLSSRLRQRAAPSIEAPMPTILIAECKQEVSSFNPVPSRYEDFSIQHGEDVLRYHRGVRNEVGG